MTDTDDARHVPPADRSAVLQPVEAGVVAQTVYDGLWLCEVCTHLVANGEYNDGTDAAEITNTAIVERWGPDTIHLVLTDAHEEFSTADCSGCGSSLHGYRHSAAVVR